MKLISNDTDLRGMDCHMHSYFSPDSSETPENIVASVRRAKLRGFIITDHVDIGHWAGCKQIDFDEYFRVWNAVRAANPDLTIYIGLEVGYDKPFVAETYEFIKDLPLEYIINSVHYWADFSTGKSDHFAWGKKAAYEEYINAVVRSLEVPYEFNTIGHFGMIERYSPYDIDNVAMSYAEFRPLMDKIIKRAIERGVRFEENTNMWRDVGEVICQPRADFLRAYKNAGGVRPMLSSDAHSHDIIGRNFDKADALITDIFGK